MRYNVKLLLHNNFVTLIPFSNTYDQVQKRADVIWRYRRYQLINDYETRPILPPPLTVLYLGYFVVQAFRSLPQAFRRVGCLGGHIEEGNGKQKDKVNELFINAYEI